MGMTSLSIVLTVFVLQLHHASPRQRPAPVWLHCLMIRYVARALCMASHVTDYYACARPGTCHAIALHNRRPSKRDVCVVGAFGADINGLQVSQYLQLVYCIDALTFLVRLLRVDLIKWFSNVCQPVRPSVRPQKVSSILVEI